MNLHDIDTATPEVLAPLLLKALQRLGQLGREGAVALAALIDDDDADLDEANEWLTDIVDGGLRD
ncbi:hypothetical protein [Sphingobium sp. B2]|uniref:hypothetical protein n=1 Tax=Sphingobium sp. B2 TaxID=2583228 RepID=UPI00119DE1AA|nr:hypothetical protein [Sphingobium sp. B2]